MTPFERQILKNQLMIMEVLSNPQQNIEITACSLSVGIDDTKELLNPINKEEPSCDMEEEQKGCGKKHCSDCDYICGEEYDGSKVFCEDCKGKFAKDKKDEVKK